MMCNCVRPRFLPNSLKPQIPPLRVDKGMEGTALRTCNSIKSKKHRDARCCAIATYGDFCTRHYKNPVRFTPSPYLSPAILERVYTRSETKSVKQIQQCWRVHYTRLRFKQQGPAANARNLAQNVTEVYSLESIATIPSVYFFSFADEKKNIWAFDIRSLSHLITTGSEVQNPYTRDTILTGTLAKIHRRLTWLRTRKYAIVYSVGENLTADQIWNQKVLDVFFKMEALGYRASYGWFDDLSVTGHENFYRNIYRLWIHDLGMSTQEKEAMVPGYNSGQTKLFKTVPDKCTGGTYDLRWWRKTNLSVILSLLTRAPQKNQQALGALYVLMALVKVVPEAGVAYPWILESVRH